MRSLPSAAERGCRMTMLWEVPPWPFRGRMGSGADHPILHETKVPCASAQRVRYENSREGSGPNLSFMWTSDHLLAVPWWRVLRDPLHPRSRIRTRRATGSTRASPRPDAFVLLQKRVVPGPTFTPFAGSTRLWGVGAGGAPADSRVVDRSLFRLVQSYLLTNLIITYVILWRNISSTSEQRGWREVPSGVRGSGVTGGSATGARLERRNTTASASLLWRYGRESRDWAVAASGAGNALTSPKPPPDLFAELRVSCCLSEDSPPEPASLVAARGRRPDTSERPDSPHRHVPRRGHRRASAPPEPRAPTRPPAPVAPPHELGFGRSRHDRSRLLDRRVVHSGGPSNPIAHRVRGRTDDCA